MFPLIDRKGSSWKLQRRGRPRLQPRLEGLEGRALLATRAFYANFDADPDVLPGVTAQFSGVTTKTSVQDYAGIGTGVNVFGGDFLRNSTGGNAAGQRGLRGENTTLTLTDLPSHTSIDLNFLLAIIDSWDGEPGTGGVYAPDDLNVYIDGQPLFSESFNNYTRYVPGSYDPQGQGIPGVVLSYGADTWKGTILWPDSAFNMGLDTARFHNIPHTASTLTIDWFASGAGWQGGDDESWAIDNVEVKLNNVPPTVGAIDAPVAPISLSAATINASASFTDPDSGDTHTATWNWGDDTNSTGTVTESGGTGTVGGSHTYTTAGVYTITLIVTDLAGMTGQSAYEFVVVYDPSAGFVTGGGWINSPVGAYAADPALAGKANLGFVSKYQKGATVPTGETEFNFRVADLDFHSTSYDWLVVAGARAQYKGTGTINGAGTYGFLLTAIDGQVRGGGGTDKFRIKIWDKATGAIIYDNQMGALDGADPATALGGGSIVLHA